MHTTHKLPNRFKLQREGLFRLSFIERVRILFGYNILAEVTVLIDKRNGRVFTEERPDKTVQDGIKLSLTPLLTAKEVREQRIRQAARKSIVKI
jgi:hypothetical protein